MQIKLYKKIDGEIRLIDYGMEECAHLYRARGFIVRPAAENDKEPVWKAPIVEKPQRNITVCHRRRKPSLWKRMAEFVNNVVDCFVPQPAFA